ncbi:hypothetical protein HGRIS_001184 [Hohenbuehelia grisea]|uniref:Uncharacterized protein n=1 Tax=Hohenbuehelia grisea TaxID=104357 RepID=A0ABR3JPJ8_9AGAR
MPATTDKPSLRNQTANSSQAQSGASPSGIHSAGLESFVGKACEGEASFETQTVVVPGAIGAGPREDHSFPLSEKAKGKLPAGTLTIRIPARATPQNDADVNELADGQSVMSATQPRTHSSHRNSSKSAFRSSVMPYPAGPRHPTIARILARNKRNSRRQKSSFAVVSETVDLGPAPMPSVNMLSNALPLPPFGGSPITMTLPQRSSASKPPAESAITPYPRAGRPSSTARVLRRIGKPPNRVKRASLLDKHKAAGASPEASAPSENAAEGAGVPVKGAVLTIRGAGQAAGEAGEPPAGVLEPPIVQPQYPQRFFNTSRRTGHSSATKRLLKVMNVKRPEAHKHPTARQKSGVRSKPLLSTATLPSMDIQTTEATHPSEHESRAEVNGLSTALASITQPPFPVTPTHDQFAADDDPAGDEVLGPKGFFDLLRHVKETSSGRPSPTRPSPTPQTERSIGESDGSSSDTASSDGQTDSSDDTADEETSDEETSHADKDASPGGGAGSSTRTSVNLDGGGAGPSTKTRGRSFSIVEEESAGHDVPEASESSNNRTCDSDGDENVVSDDGDAWYGFSHDVCSSDAEDARMVSDLEDDAVFPSLGDKLLDSYMKEFMSSPENRFLTRRDVPVLLQMLSSMLAKRGPADETTFSATPPEGTPARGNEPRSQSKSEIGLKRHIRDFMRETLNLYELPIQVPSSAELKAFSDSKDPHLGPSLDALRLDLAGDALHTPWNHRAVKLLTQKFLQDPDFHCKDSKRVKVALFRHFITLRHQYRSFLEENGVLEVDEQEEQARIDKARDKAKKNRQRNLRKRRMGAFRSYRRDPSMAQLLPVMESLPWTAMSGDDADHRKDDLRYIKAHPTWRSKMHNVTQFFETLDALHLSTRFADDGRPLPGQFPHRRKKSSREELFGSVPHGLPENFYDAQWLEKSGRREELGIKPPVDLNFSPAIKKIAYRFRKAVTHKHAPLDPDVEVPFDFLA